jgi:uncharacterized protein YjbI with pentapeptide repeats
VTQQTHVFIFSRFRHFRRLKAHTVSIDFTEADLINADLTGSWITAMNPSIFGGEATIDFTEADLTNADLSGSKIDASGYSATIDFTEADLANANLTGWKITVPTMR